MCRFAGFLPVNHPLSLNLHAHCCLCAGLLEFFICKPPSLWSRMCTVVYVQVCWIFICEPPSLWSRMCTVVHVQVCWILICKPPSLWSRMCTVVHVQVCWVPPFKPPSLSSRIHTLPNQRRMVRQAWWRPQPALKLCPRCVCLLKCVFTRLARTMHLHVNTVYIR